MASAVQLYVVMVVTPLLAGWLAGWLACWLDGLACWLAGLAGWLGLASKVQLCCDVGDGGGSPPGLAGWMAGCQSVSQSANPAWIR